MSESNSKDENKVDSDVFKNRKIVDIENLKFEINSITTDKIIFNIFSYSVLVLFFCFSSIYILSKIGFSIEKMAEISGIQVSVSDSGAITQIYKITPVAIFLFGSAVSVLIYYRIKNSVSNKNDEKDFECKKLMLSKLILEKTELESYSKSLNNETEKKFEYCKKNINEVGSKLDFPLIHGSISQQWFAIIILQLAPSILWLIYSFLVNPTHSELSVWFLIVCNLIAFPLGFIGSAFNCFLSKILVSFTSTRTWFLTTLISGNVYIGLIGLIFGFFMVASIHFSFENIYSFNATIVLFAFISTLFFVLLIGGRIVWKRKTEDVVKAIIIPFAFSAIIFIAIYFYSKSKIQSLVKKSKISQESSSKSYQPTPESQFLDFQKSRMGPSYDVLDVMMSIKNVQGNKVIYSGFYRYKISGTSHIDMTSFSATFDNERFVGWLPNR